MERSTSPLASPSDQKDFQVNEISGQGSTGNVLAAICSFFLPGLGQLVQGRPIAALIHFLLCSVLWLIFMGWVIHIWSTLDAAWYRPPERY